MKNRLRTMKAIFATLGITALLHTVPAHADTIHVIAKGNTFYSLSKQYGVDLTKLVSSNPQIAALNMYPGLEVTIPGVEQAKKNTVATLSVAPESSTVEAWGKSFNYDKTIQVKASAYSSAASENGKWGAVDYFGNPLKLGTIAVDPSIIPLGTKVLVTGHSHPGLPKQAFLATATDKGSAIKGNRIDIFIPGSQSFVADFGYQYVQLYVVNQAD
ncbi:3D domain-containing protein [Paenibacillus donghaensis]|uniref:LysM domain-containing protein n=1 Tax=Paenibacillus donghaensis TaxID=414771 RepID=A0A2Z2K932_9BACL|nr:3D domain-containing protein [Paenibacillus donghaensis]ASA21857.1 hypothetical protein B9T62_14375 [Paenibacillus donghaensis]